MFREWLANVRWLNLGFFFATLLSFTSISSKAATVVRFPILLKENGKIMQIQDVAKDLEKAQVNLPEAVELNFINSPEEVLPQLNTSVDKLSQLRNSNLQLVLETEIKTFLMSNIKNKLCYYGDRNLALRLLPHFSSSFFAGGTTWVGYRLKGQSDFNDFTQDKKAELSGYQSAAALKRIQQALKMNLKDEDIQIFTEATQVSPIPERIEIDVISACEVSPL